MAPDCFGWMFLIPQLPMLVYEPVHIQAGVQITLAERIEGCRVEFMDRITN
jgi:hypothetical protein